MGVIKDRNVFLGNIRKTNALPMKYAKIGLANKGNSGFHFLLSWLCVGTKIRWNDCHEVAEGDGSRVREGGYLAEKEFKVQCW